MLAQEQGIEAKLRDLLVNFTLAHLGKSRPEIVAAHFDSEKRGAAIWDSHKHVDIVLAKEKLDEIRRLLNANVENYHGTILLIYQPFKEVYAVQYGFFESGNAKYLFPREIK